jgi:hypothetical protein
MTKTGLFRTLVYVAIFLAAFGYYVTRAANSGGLGALPEAGDGQDYDAIAFNVWQGRGFGYYWSDEAYRRPYEGNRRYGFLLRRRSEYYPTTYRPPAMPFLMASVYALTDRSFAAWRVVNCGIMAGAVTAAAATAAHFGGVPAALLTAAVAVRNPKLTDYSSRFLTEALATFLVALLAWQWVSSAQRGWTARRAAASGVTLGALLAARTIFVLWMPVVLILPGKDLSFGSRFAWRTRATCLLMAVLVISPWWIRNIAVTGALMPLGTQGGINLPMAFGQRALNAQGLWRSNFSDGAPEIMALGLDPVTTEVRLAKYRAALATKWMREHPVDTLRLMYLHVWQELRPRHDPISNWLLPAAGLAAIVLRRSPGAWAIVFMVCANILSVAMTYSARGRFMVPVQPILIALVAAMIVTAPGRMLALLRRAPG